MRAKSDFQPEWVSHPADTLQAALSARGLEAAGLAAKTALPETEICRVLNRSEPISERFAEELERGLGTPARFWNARQRQYDEALLGFAATSAWYQELPLAAMRKLGWIATGSHVHEFQEVLDFFAVGGPGDWTRKYGSLLKSVNFRETLHRERSDLATVAWLRQAIRVAPETTRPFDANALRATIPSLRGLTKRRDFVEGVTSALGSCGVSLSLVPSLQGVRAYGAATWLEDGRALVAMSFRQLSNDHFWFSLFHELGHVLLHPTTSMFLDDIERSQGEDVETMEREEEANKFAQEILFPGNTLTSLREMARTETLSHKRIISFAQDIGIAPGIVAGQIQHLKLAPFSHYNKLKRRYEWSPGFAEIRERRR